MVGVELFVVPVMVTAGAGYVKVSEMGEIDVAVALTERLISLAETMLATVAPEGMPEPLTLMPTTIPSVLDRPVTEL